MREKIGGNEEVWLHCRCQCATERLTAPQLKKKTLKPGLEAEPKICSSPHPLRPDPNIKHGFDGRHDLFDDVMQYVDHTAHLPPAYFVRSTSFPDEYEGEVADTGQHRFQHVFSEDSSDIL
jgi:hypothetical protein